MSVCIKWVFVDIKVFSMSRFACVGYVTECGVSKLQTNANILKMSWYQCVLMDKNNEINKKWYKLYVE